MDIHELWQGVAAFWHGLMAGEPIFVWLIIGFLAQGLFFMRFFVQWIASERQRRSIIPVAFWYFSLAGGTTLLAYAIHRQDPVFIVGQGAGLIIYSRNLYFIWRRRGEEGTAG